MSIIKYKHRRRQVTLKEYFEIIGLPSVNGELHRLTKRYINELKKKVFLTRLELMPYEIEVLIDDVTTTNELKIIGYAKLKQNITKSYTKYSILINTPGFNDKGADIVFVIATPRSGNIAIAEAIGRILDYQKTSAVSIKSSDFSRAVEPLVVQVHEFRKDFLRYYKNKNNYKVITIKRHPLDVMLSAFRIGQQTAACSSWVNGSVFPQPFMYKGISPASSKFAKWALSSKAASLIGVSGSWLDVADSVIKYEDFIQDPESVMKKVLNDLNMTKKTSDVKIKKVVDDISNNFLKDYKYYQHRWTSGSDNWQKYISMSVAEKIYRKHKKMFKKLGYDIDTKNKFSEKEIMNNNINW